MQAKFNNQFWYLVFTVLIVLLFVVNLSFGSVMIPFPDVWKALFSEGDSIANIIIGEYRLPQAITAMATGMALAMSGLLLQSIFRNPLAGPSVLGISSGASLGVALVVLVGGAFSVDMLGSALSLNEFAVMLAAFTGAFVVLMVILFVSNRIGNAVVVLIIGIMIGYTVSAVVGVLQFFSRAEELHAYVLWGLGSFSKTSFNQSVFLMLSLGVGLVFSFLLMKPLNAILLGENYAKSLGVNTVKLQTTVILLAGYLIALSTAFTGPVAFIGLAVPHIARGFFQTSNHRTLVPAVILIGGALTLLCNLISKLPGYDTSLPINAVTSVIGAPVVIWVIMKRGKVKR